ncbi:SCO2322 family protein [Intrasporangium calvum]|uniref:SCO2322 family protein n=1 Tax=Intrasporangium calvum TaxID=53358 RepID=A0ABT5GMI5_9MICO|nr:SCO2322 family protein [Intrasporangium calvum]MDC5699085.1 SCO2322 family protein [Intrasporangium calvum]
MSFAHRVPVRVALIAVLAAAISLLSLAPAHAAAYRFWGFYQLTDGQWAFAQKGPDQIVPEDGSVEGWRFAVADMNDTRFPRATLTFDQLCGSTAAETGKKRVGLIVDFGRPADAADGATPPEPQASCAVVPADATSTDVLATAGELRVENSLICAVAGYPAADCGGEVKELSAEAKAADTPVQVAAPAAPAATSAAPTPEATTANAPAEETSSGTSTAAYVIAALTLLALLVLVIARSRAARRGQG